jgi:hypothetical protein
MTIGGGRAGDADEIARPLWSVDLGLSPGRDVRLDARGRWLVATSTMLASFEPDGRRRWEVETLGKAQPPVLANDGSLLRVEGDLVVSRDPDSGALVRSFSAPLAFHVTVDPWGGLIYSQADPGGVAMLRCVTMTGASRWSLPLDGPGPLALPALVAGDTAVVQYGGLLRALDRNGEARWLAGHGGFRDVDRGGEVVAAEEADTTWTSTRLVNPTTLLAALRWHTGHGLFLVDAAARTVKRYVNGFVPQAPILVISGMPEDSYRVAVQGPMYEVRQMDWQWSVVMLDSSGSRLWEHRLHAPPLWLARAADDTLIVSGTPTRKRWADYGKWQDLSKDAYVRCLNADGTQRWTWYGPGPLTNHPVVGPDGVVYVGSEGRLWALPPG